MNQTTPYWQLWHRNIGKVDIRGLRKVIIATMFITVAFVYLDQLANWRFLLTSAPEVIRLAATPFTVLIAATIGASYLWRMRIPHSVETTILAIFGAHWLELGIVPTLYEWDGHQQGVLWTVFAHTSYAIMLAITYIAAYLLFTTWRAQYRYKLIMAGVLIVLIIISEIMQPRL